MPGSGAFLVGAMVGDASERGFHRELRFRKLFPPGPLARGGRAALAAFAIGARATAERSWDCA